MRPDDFWNSTLDECILTYQGKVDEWRFFRSGFNLVHCSLVEKPVDMLKVLPLPYDDELAVEEKSDDLFTDYEKYHKVANG